MKTNSLVLSFALLALVACSSGPQVTKVDVEEPQFKVLEATPGGREMWLENPHSYAVEMGEDKGYNTKDNYYYTGDAKGTSKRLTCEKAQANVVDDIAKQVATFVDTSIARATNESTAEDSEGSSQVGETSEETERISSQLSKVQLTNIMTQKKYWEKRDYSQAGGAKSVYYCWVLAHVGKKEVQELVRRASRMKLQKNDELRAKVEGKLENLSADYEKYQQTH